LTCALFVQQICCVEIIFVSTNCSASRGAELFVFTFFLSMDLIFINLFLRFTAKNKFGKKNSFRFLLCKVIFGDSQHVILMNENGNKFHGSQFIEVASETKRNGLSCRAMVLYNELENFAGNERHIYSTINLYKFIE
jgi:hypothetical protein